MGVTTGAGGMDVVTGTAITPVDSGAESGTGGGDMSLWSYSRDTRLRSGIHQAYANQSSYTFASGVVDARSTFDRGFEEGEKDLVDTPLEVDDGQGGGDMALWTYDRVTMLDSGVRIAYGNQSSYSIPKGVVDANNSFDRGFQQGEIGLGVNVSGKASWPDGTALSGTVYIEAADTVFTEKFVSGTFSASTHPPVGVQLGTSLGYDEYNFRFTPSVAGLDYFVGNMGLRPDTFAVSYANIEGKVKDYYGNPVKSVQVKGEGASTASNANGDYSFLAPAGVETTLVSLYDSHTKTFTLNEGETRKIDWQFGMLRITTYTPTLEPIPNAPATINGEYFETDQSGVLEISEARIKQFDITALNYWRATVEIQSEGQLIEAALGTETSPFETPGGRSYREVGATGVKIRCYDSDTGGQIRRTAAETSADAIRSTSNDRGIVALTIPDPGEAKIVVGTGDNRYLQSSFITNIAEGEMNELEVELEPRTQVTNT